VSGSRRRGSPGPDRPGGPTAGTWLHLTPEGDASAGTQLLGRIADRLKAMADPLRLRILHLLQHGELCVTDILSEVGGSQANVSKHLALLRQSGLLECRREGVHNYYRIADSTVFDICRSVCDSLERQIQEDRRGVAAGRAAILGGG